MPSEFERLSRKQDRRKRRRSRPRLPSLRSPRRPLLLPIVMLIIGVTGVMAIEFTRLPPTEITGLTRVRDGDTLVVGGQPVRLRGLHCPELGRTSGERARRAIAELIEGRPIMCELSGERTYDRMVGRCYAGGVDLAAELIRNGYCARCPRYDPWMRYLDEQWRAGWWVRGLPDYC